MFTYEVVQEGLTVEDLLRSNWRLGKKIVHELRMAKAVTVNGEPVLWKDPLKKGVILNFAFDMPQSNYMPTENCDVTIRYEDEHCLIVSKP
ncbi:MAG: hypothetical protein RR581_09705, partial [Eubacterium sp.]